MAVLAVTYVSLGAWIFVRQLRRYRDELQRRGQHHAVPTQSPGAGGSMGRGVRLFFIWAYVVFGALLFALAEATVARGGVHWLQFVSAGLMWWGAAAVSRQLRRSRQP